MGNTKFSRHVLEDRLDRCATIATKVGFGEVLYTSTYSDREGRWHNRTVQLTSTGVCIVRAEDNTIVTMYCATLAIVKSYFHIEKLPRELFAAIRLNERKGYCNLQLQYPIVVVGSTTISFYQKDLTNGQKYGIIVLPKGKEYNTMTRAEADKILCYLAQEWVSPLCFADESKTVADVYDELSSTKFSEVCRLINDMIPAEERTKR